MIDCLQAAAITSLSDGNNVDVYRIHSVSIRMYQEAIVQLLRSNPTCMNVLTSYDATTVRITESGVIYRSTTQLLPKSAPCFGVHTCDIVWPRLDPSKHSLRHHQLVYLAGSRLSPQSSSCPGTLIGW
uniref:Uncharacterized protein n=1 Tax=Timema cristinae TaxID=61476 RepID=A0A7R9CJH9_TIMCR|nr:unnamed protein product [Timema cristinae]